jgi:hypothetical protein
MSIAEYLAFIPLLLYGLGLSILLGEWKRIFDRSQIFLPYTLMTLSLTEIAVYNVFIYSRILDQMSELNYLEYLLLLISPFLFFLVAHVYTPEPGDDTKEHFIKRMPLVYTLIALVTASNFIYNLDKSLSISIGRIIFIIVVLIAGFTRKIWITYVLILIWLVSLFLRGNIVSQI